MTTEIASFKPVLELLARDCEHYFGAADASFEPLRAEERRGSSLLHVKVKAGGDEFGAFVKIYRLMKSTSQEIERLRARVARDYSTTRLVHDAMIGDSLLGAVWPIAHFPEQLAIVTRQAEGLQLGRVVERVVRRSQPASTADDLIATMRTVGRWLARFQQIPAAPATTLRLDETIAYVDVRLKKLADAGLITNDERGAVACQLDEIWQQIPEHHLRTVPIHADYCLGNVLIDDSRVVVLDFAMTRHGAIYHDLSHMFLQIQMMQVKPWFQPQLLDALCAAMVEGYAPGTRQDEPLFRLLMIHHVINHLTKITVRAPRRRLSRPLNWLLRRRHLAWLRENGCFDSRRTA